MWRVGVRISEAFAIDREGNEFRIAKGAFAAISTPANAPADARRTADDLGERGHRIIVFAIRAGRIGFQRLLTYTFNMLVKKIEIVIVERPSKKELDPGIDSWV